MQEIPNYVENGGEKVNICWDLRDRAAYNITTILHPRARIYWTQFMESFKKIKHKDSYFFTLFETL